MPATRRLSASAAVRCAALPAAVALLVSCSDRPPRRDDGFALPCDAPWQGDLQLGGSGADEALALVALPDDRLLVAGYRDGVLGQSTVEPSGDARAWVASIAPSGAIEWERALDTGGTDTLEALALQGDAALAVGRTTGTLPGQTAAGKQDLFLARLPLDGGGAFEVLRQSGTVRAEHPRGVSVAGDLVLAAGWFDIYVPDGGSGVERWEDELVAAWRLDGGGATLEWLRSGTFDGDDRALSVWADPAAPGEHVVTGVVLAGAERGPFVRRVRADGSIAWSRRLTPVAYDVAAAVAGAPDGDVVVAGSTYAELAGRNQGQLDAYVLKLDAKTGETRWGVQVGSAESDWVTAMALDARGNVVIAGETLGDVTGDTPNAGAFDPFAYLVGLDGAVLGAWQRGTEEDEEVHGVAIDRCGRIFVAGATRGALAGASGGSKDLFVVRAEPSPAP